MHQGKIAEQGTEERCQWEVATQLYTLTKEIHSLFNPSLLKQPVELMTIDVAHNAAS